MAAAFLIHFNSYFMLKAGKKEPPCIIGSQTHSPEIGPRTEDDLDAKGPQDLARLKAK
ncbi:hypothetical protein HPP92_025515 [Vanilla planifolia]|uniref:Uncharacterized protein n=1 Tax=Vanilla planifolia TaxID=51239 RepID=A0A835PIL4_VANPL|nr:hypothetical protein HPP92_025515 [Vanilla planifolia]